MKYCSRARWVTDKYILLMLGVFPLFVGFHGYSRITASKFWFFVVATSLWLLTAAVLMLIGRSRGERPTLELRASHVALGLFLAVGGLSAVASEYGAVCLAGGNRYDGYLTTVLYVLTFFGVSLLAVPRRRYAWAMGISAAACCAIAVMQLFGMDPFRLYPTGTNYYDKYVAYNSAFLGTIGNTGLLAAYLCLAAPLLTVWAIRAQKRIDRLLAIPAALALAMLLLCDVDAGLVALMGCALVSVPVCIRNKRAARIAACVSLGLVVIGLAAVWFWPGQSGTVYEMSQLLRGNLADEFGSHRGEIWKQGWRLFREKPWLGGGPGTTAMRFDIRWYSEVRGTTAVVTNAHNVYLGYLINTGLLGLLPYLGAIGCSLVTWLRRRGEGEGYPALGAAFLCYLIQDFFGLGLAISAPMLWVIWGLLESGETGELDPPEK